MINMGPLPAPPQKSDSFRITMIMELSTGETWGHLFDLYHEQGRDTFEQGISEMSRSLWHVREHFRKEKS